MRPSRLRLLILTCLACATLTGQLLTAETATATNLPFLSPLFSDNLVLQREQPNRIWGWAKPGDTIRVEIGEASATAVAGANGRWEAKLQPPAAGGPYTVKITGPRQSVVLHEVLVGDVWLCGGQSNMQFGLGRAENGDAETKAANHPQIRLFEVAGHAAYSPAAVPNGSWKICSPQTAGNFSAVAYFYGRKLQDELHVPIGLIADCMGGTPAESWMRPETLRQRKDFDAPLDELERFRAQAVPEPVAARYAWQANPAATLFNGAGLPAAPFRTDDWPGITEKQNPW